MVSTYLCTYLPYNIYDMVTFCCWMRPQPSVGWMNGSVLLLQQNFDPASTVPLYYIHIHTCIIHTRHCCTSTILLSWHFVCMHWASTTNLYHTAASKEQIYILLLFFQHTSCNQLFSSWTIFMVYIYIYILYIYYYMYVLLHVQQCMFVMVPFLDFIGTNYGLRYIQTPTLCNIYQRFV